MSAEARADLVPLALEEVIGRRGGAVAGQLLHGPMVKVGQHLRLPAVPHVGADRTQVGGGEHVQHLQQLGRADLHGEADDQFFVARIAAEGEVIHPQMLVDEKLDDLRLVRLKAQPPAGLLGDFQSDLAVIFQQPLAQVVDQQGEVQEMLVLQPSINPPHRPRVVKQPLGELDGPDAMLIDRVLVILIELQQPAGTGEIGKEALQDRHVMQVAKERSQAAGMGQQGEKMAAGLGRQLGRQVRRLVANFFPGKRGDRHVVQVGQVDHLHDRREVAAEPRQAAPRDHHADGADQVIRLDMVAKEDRQGLVEPWVCRGLRQELRGHVADAVRMAEVVAHEMLDRQEAVGRHHGPEAAAARPGEVVPIG